MAVGRKDIFHRKSSLSHSLSLCPLSLSLPPFSLSLSRSSFFFSFSSVTSLSLLCPPHLCPTSFIYSLSLSFSRFTSSFSPPSKSALIFPLKDPQAQWLLPNGRRRDSLAPAQGVERSDEH